MRAAIYARFSTDRQNESSIIDQVRVCTEYAHRRGWDIAGRFKDEGISGDALGNRPGVQMMIRGSEAREFDALVVMDLHRLARTEDLPPLIKRLKFRGVLVVGVQDGFESTAPTARMQAGLASIMGGEFIEMVKRRTYSALQMRAMDGKPTGGRAYGYRDGEDDRVEAFIVQEIFGSSRMGCRRER
ncbi:MAG: Resolvase domain [Gammaproteobacteria bacterium]|nr:Resolvase domain [Gammaproteobacteria bacterium]